MRFGLSQSPASLSYFGHGQGVLWELLGTARIPLTEAILGRLSVGERSWLVQFEKFYRRVYGVLSRDPTRWGTDDGLVGHLSYYPDSITRQALHRLALLGDDCGRTLKRAGDPGRFGPVRKIVENACRRFRAAAKHFMRAAAVSPNAAPEAGTAQEREFTNAFEEGIDDVWYGLHPLVRAHDRALVIMSARR